MTTTPLDIGIAGCGTAGAAAAIFLARAGHTVTVYEEAPDPQPVGAGIVLQPGGMQVLARLGLGEQIAKAGSVLRNLFARTTGGRTLINLHYATLSDRLYGLGLHRGTLFKCLYDTAREAGATVRCGCQVVGISEDSPRCFFDRDAQRLGPHQLLIVADGAKSVLRPAVNLRSSVRPYTWGALWFIGSDVHRAADERLYQIVRGTSIMLGLLPTGHSPGMSESDPPLASLYWSIRGDRVAAWREAGLDAWKQQVRALMPETEGVLDQIHEPAQVLYASYHDVRMRPLHTRDVVFMGDAAHAMSPQLGQGCNLALIDASVLADCMAEQPDVASALRAWAAARGPQLRYYQWATRWLTPFFQSDIPPAGWLRDLMFPVMNALPPLRGQMVRSMAGVKRGLLRRSQPLRPLIESMPHVPDAEAVQRG
ncbi:MAG: FAD-dependent oxidoreductase [Planctomycetota bacterium]